MSIQELAASHPEVREMLLRLEEHEKNNCFPAGHFYSPVFSIEELKARENEIWKGMDQRTVAGIDMNDAEQVALTKAFEEYYPEMPFKDDPSGLRYYLQNNFYAYTDGIILYAMMRHLRPKRIIEVGSGFSSAVMLDTKDCFNMETELVFIEPYPDRLYSLLKEQDHQHCQIHVNGVQQVQPELFKELERNDILFIDSSHVVKTGSDLHYLIFEVLPVLKPGVFIHFHDIFYPFEYPKKWVFQGRNWNENYFLRAFLMHNQAYKIRFFAHFMHLHYSDAFKNMPLCYKNGGGNFWLEKIA